MSSTGVERDSVNGGFVDRDLFRDVIGHFASGVTIITARKDETDFGILGVKPESAMVVRSQQPFGVVLTATSIWTER